MRLERLTIHDLNLFTIWVVRYLALDGSLWVKGIPQVINTTLGHSSTYLNDS